jgi:subtilisin family serine protease
VLSTYILPNGALGYVFAGGTSMAVPHVSGIAAMVRSLHPEWTPGHVRAHLKSSSERIGSKQLFGAGLIDAAAAVD